MPTTGKITASKVTETQRIMVRTPGGRFYGPSTTRTGEGVSVARVLAKTFRPARGPYERSGKYVIETSAGTFEAAPSRTIWLAPEA